jgi:hypothetical protein
MPFVLLTDNNGGSLLVACESTVEAEQVGQSAIWSGGGVSAWLVPAEAVKFSDDLVRQLSEDCSLYEIHDTIEEYVKVRTKVKK